MRMKKAIIFAGLLLVMIEVVYVTWIPKQIRCGAAKTVCSIDAIGNVYPCQTLHYEGFFMGNLLVPEIRFAYNKTGSFSSLFCPIRYENSLSMLLSLDNRTSNKY